MTEIKIPNIKIPEIIVPQIHLPQTYIPNYEHSNINVIGCNYYHRDTRNTGNRNLILDDPNGVMTDCPFPSFTPLIYDAENLIITEQAAPATEQEKLPEGKPPKTEIPKKKDEEPLIPDCPDKNDRRIGEYTSEARTERIKSYRRGSDGIECIAEYESVTFVDSFLPSPSAALNVATISIIAATSPLILNAIKPLIKNAIKKLTKKKDKST